MRVELKDILILFERIQELTNIAYVSVVVFCGVDMDSLCTLKIFSVRPPPRRSCCRARTCSTRCTRSPPSRS